LDALADSAEDDPRSADAGYPRLLLVCKAALADDDINCREEGTVLDGCSPSFRREVGDE